MHERCVGEPIGYLRFGGDRNWFISQSRGDDFTRGRDRNNMWALTQADRKPDGTPGAFGYVPEVYFRGGDTDEPDAGLQFDDAGPLNRVECGHVGSLKVQ